MIDLSWGTQGQQTQVNSLALVSLEDKELVDTPFPGGFGSQMEVKKLRGGPLGDKGLRLVSGEAL